MEKANQLKINLFDPGMTFIHRVGLAGLYATAKRLTKDQKYEKLHFELNPTNVIIKWEDELSNSFDAFFKDAFKFTMTPPKGLIDFAAHRGTGIGDVFRVEISKAILDSFLQHNKQNKIPKGVKNESASLLLDEEAVVVDYRPFVKRYAHSEAASLMFTSQNVLKKSVPIKTWLFPGSSQRHSALSGTEMEETVERFLCLLFAPTSCLYIKLRHKNAQGQFESSKLVAICFPYVTNLEKYFRSYLNYLRAPIEKLAADGLNEAALSTLLLLKADDSMEDLGVDGCAVFTMGKLGWDKQQINRTSAITLEDIQKETLDLFELATSIIPNHIKIRSRTSDNKNVDNSKSYYVSTSMARGLIAENIATHKEWFSGFTRLMSSKDLARSLSFEKGGLAKMIEKMPWALEADKYFVQAIHLAIKNRYGALAAQATQRGEKMRFDKEFEKMRSGLMRAKNISTLRAELADIFARGGLNRTLQKQWEKILPLYLAEDWQKSRDLALLGLASYAGKGSDEIYSEVQTNDGKDEQ